jgi:steroid 5-alpha reductase family enzyme
MGQPHTSLSTSDYIFGSLGFLIILTEFISDNQQYSFQTFKHSGKLNPNEWPGAKIQWTKHDAERGFVTRGLWAWSRHPNFLCEQSFWVCTSPFRSFVQRSNPFLMNFSYQIIITLIPLFSPDSPKLDFPPTSFASLTPFLPCLVICSLFFSSTIFTESISKAKYPVAYSAYQERVAMFLPLLTPVWGALLVIQGRKGSVDSLVYGTGSNSKGKGKAE